MDIPLNRKEMIKILITFDYELPLGGVESYEKGLFEPAEKIISLGKKLNVPFCFFADVCSAIKFKDWDYNGYYHPFAEQLQKALSCNQDVQLHIHPHWLTSDYKNGTFIPSRDYSLFNFADKEGYSIDSVVKRSVEELYKICQVADKNHKLVAYRAGGYSMIEKHSEIFNALRKNRIVIDSSILPGYYLKTPTHTLDFKSVLKNNWRVGNNLYEESDSGIWEIPITNMPVNLPFILKRRINKILNKSSISQRKYQHTGKGMFSGHIKKTIIDNLRELFNPVSLSFDGSHTTIKDLEKIVSYNVNKFEKDNDPVYITAISHPKSMGDYNISLLEEFVIKMREKYGNQIEFISYKTIT